MKRVITIRLDHMPQGVSDEDAAVFILDWATCGGGCLFPEDPLFRSLPVTSVTCGKVVIKNDL